MSKIIGIVSGKGGVGKTTTVANLGTIFSREYKTKTVMVDANLFTTNLGIHLGLLDPPTTLQDVLRAPNVLSIKKVVYTTVDGLQVVPCTISLSQKVKYSKIGPVLKPLREMFDLIILDSAPGLSHETEFVMKVSDQIILVTTPDLPSVTDTLKAARVTEEFKIPIIGVVVNRVQGHKHELSIQEIERTIGHKVIAVIPEDEHVREAISARKPAALHSPNCSATKAFRKLAQYLQDFESTMQPPEPRFEEVTAFSRQGFLSRLLQLLRFYR
ncbi:P-loop NTPase [Candidatus Micrarchaeota archaeon]|nr:P-loop NTPase [Candidatus Micrarchaeota archaeon]